MGGLSVPILGISLQVKVVFLAAIIAKVMGRCVMVFVFNSIDIIKFEKQFSITNSPIGLEGPVYVGLQQSKLTLVPAKPNCVWFVALHPRVSHFMWYLFPE